MTPLLDFDQQSGAFMRFSRNWQFTIDPRRPSALW